MCIGEPAEYGQWTSPVQAPGFPATELIASWNADTPPGTWLRVSARTRTSTGAVTPWYVLAEWAHGDTDIRRTTIPGQDDEHAAVDVDTLTVEPGVRLHAYQLRVSLLRVAGSQVTPVLRAVGALASALPDRFTVPVSAPGRARGIELPVPRFAQNVHRGNYPEYGGGGESWCSPASTAMVLAYWGRGPDAAELAWLPPGYPDRPVAHAARCTYDHAYHGTGNWPFNTAYAAHYGLRGRVTRLRSLTELEDYLADGVPVITSQSFLASELDGAGYDTAGHLLVVTGCTEDGDVIVNDPAADDVRRVYPRAQFETIWQRTRRHTADGTVAGGPGGIAYLIEP
ncbi:peptidase C39 family protein [Saccharomonospora sp. NPDC046836]|uniref:peptidase C39 family protein n=1 Tax=Saccharomonospora sp. NPDC046836 TaxID=3156921 RepID=UPI0033E25E4E